MKKYALLIVTTFFTVTLLSQTEFERGFDNGYKKGYCQDKGIGCIEPIPPIAPIPKTSENSESYSDGYNRGFKMGMYASKEKPNTRKGYKTTKTKFIDFTYEPNYEFAFELVKNVQKGLDEAQKEMMKGNYDNAIYICKEVLIMLPEQVSANQLLSLCYLQKYKNEKKESLANLARYHAREAAKTKKYEFMVSMIEKKLEEYFTNTDSKPQTTNITNYNQLLKDVQTDYQNKEYEIVINKLKTIEEKIEQGVITKKSTIFFTYYILSYSHYNKNNLAETIKYTTQAIDNSLNNEIGNLYFLRGLSKSNIGDYYGANKDYDYLIENYKKINYNSNNLATLYNNKGYNLILLKKYKKAEPLVNKALSLDKTTDYIWATKGELEYYLGNYSDAVSAMSKSIKIKPTANSYYFRGLAEIELGNKEKGCSDLSKSGEMGEIKAYTEIKNKCNK